MLVWTKIVLSGAATIILIPVAIYFARYYWDRRRWHTFEKLIRTWAREGHFLPEDLTAEDWSSLAATMLNDAGYEPVRINELIELAVLFAKGLVSLETTGKISSGWKGEGDGEPNAK